MATSLDLPTPRNVADEVRRVVTIFRELRSGATEDRRQTLKSTSGGLSTAEAIGVMVSGISQSTYFNDGQLDAASIGGSMLGAIVKDPVQDRVTLDEYLESVLRTRRGYEGYYAALSGRA